MPHAEILETAEPARLALFDEIIDVRSPAEFAEDHIPGAVNLPVLNNEERALIGTIYVQDSAFRARRIGAALVARNVAHHLDYGAGGSPGGLPAADLLLAGRAAIQRDGDHPGPDRLAHLPARRRLQDLSSAGSDPALRYGSGPGPCALGRRHRHGEDRCVASLAGLGVQTLDLEALAEHRGSLFGGWPGVEQPKQKMFESWVLSALEGFDPKRAVVVEAESHKVGDRMIPPALWQAMARAPHITLSAPRPERAQYLVDAYTDLSTDKAALKAIVARLPIHIGRKDVEALLGRIDRGELVELADSLIELHYDPAYARSVRDMGPANIGHIELSAIGEEGIQRAAHEIATILGRNSVRGVLEHHHSDATRSV